MTTATKELITVSAFGIEADHPRNCDLLLQSVPNCRLRSKLLATRTVKTIDKATGEEIEMVPPDQAAALGQYPQVPGMQIHVDTKNGKIVITDPLEKDEALCERLTRAMKASGIYQVDRKVRGVPTRSEALDPHRMKTLIREMRQLVEIGHAQVVKGVLPDIEDIDEMPGNYLLNPGARVQNMQPRFEKDWDEWYKNMQTAGG